MYIYDNYKQIIFIHYFIIPVVTKTKKKVEERRKVKYRKLWKYSYTGRCIYHLHNKVKKK